MAKRKVGLAKAWWARALADGEHCERKRRARYFEEYREAAELALLPGELSGPFNLLYTMGFRLGYDNSKLRRERENAFLPRPRKRGTLAK